MIMNMIMNMIMIISMIIALHYHRPIITKQMVFQQREERWICQESDHLQQKRGIHSDDNEDDNDNDDGNDGDNDDDDYNV